MNFHEETIEELLDMYYQGILDELKILRIDMVKLVIHDERIDSTIAIDLKRAGIDTNSPGWYNSKFEKYDYQIDNPKLKYYPRKGFFQKEYCEFLITYSPFYNDSIQFNFSIDSIDVHIGEPSNLFKLMFNHIIYDDHSDGTWDMFQTISLHGVKESEAEVILEQALYYLSRKFPSDYNDYPEIITFYGEDGQIDHFEYDNDDSTELSYTKSQYNEVFIFYNEARRKHDPLSFYRVLEYFFIINRKSEFNSIIDYYNQDKNIDKLILDVTKIFRKDEEKLLAYLLNTLDTKEILSLALKKGLIEKETNEDLAQKLYNFRNSIVHSKKEDTNKFLLPGPLSSMEKDKWLPILEKLAMNCIMYFCN
ncbi:hypothetical protein [uncultured Metabacillus sp.]|uniref:hypothetical protein n=1 Tax=uncultured Metabacillus sp. TaxID=2860135 RepID=UPI00261E73F5|nr:hypothetical protein [uncultured Metabacillus sp.]